MHQKQHLAALKTVGKALMVETIRFASELVETTELSFPSDELVRPQELEMAAQLVDNLAESFKPEKYTDDYRANLMKVIRAKMKGQKIEAPEPEEPESTQVLDLMARLQASLEQTTSRRGKSGEPGKRRTRRRSTA